MRRRKKKFPSITGLLKLLFFSSYSGKEYSCKVQLNGAIYVTMRGVIKMGNVDCRAELKCIGLRIAYYRKTNY